jgi:hypothetical protein
MGADATTMAKKSPRLRASLDLQGLDYFLETATATLASFPSFASTDASALAF